MRIKSLVPSSLFGRFLLIIVLPMVLVQLIATYVFYERHWNSVSRHMSASLAGEVAMLTYVLQQRPEDEQQRIIAIADHNLYINAFLKKGEKLAPAKNIRKVPAFREFHQELKKLVSSPFTVASVNNGNDVEIKVQLADGVLHILTTNKRLENQTTYIFILWMTGSAALLLVISVLFSKNQIRAITRLAKAAEAFGRGLEITDFKPEGAKEVQQASRAFLRMKARIQRQVTKRTQMLAGVSHDLRTPLTRMKLQLAMLGETEEVRALQEDVGEMEKMIQEYLDFVRGEGTEVAISCDVSALVKDIVAPYQLKSSDLTLETGVEAVLPLRPQAMKRAIVNLLENAIRFAEHIRVALREDEDNVILTIDDDGPGIPEEEYASVFKPFYRIDRSRNLNTGGVGLGLTIARDIITSHGGEIALRKSELGGLRVTILLPR